MKLLIRRTEIDNTEEKWRKDEGGGRNTKTTLNDTLQSMLSRRRRVCNSSYCSWSRNQIRSSDSTKGRERNAQKAAHGRLRWCGEHGIDSGMASWVPNSHAQQILSFIAIAVTGVPYTVALIKILFYNIWLGWSWNVCPNSLDGPIVTVIAHT